MGDFKAKTKFNFGAALPIGRKTPRSLEDLKRTFQKMDVNAPMFHRALTLRNSLEIGTILPVLLSSTRKSLMPWTSGDLPVATVVHSRGERGGVFVRILP